MPRWIEGMIHSFLEEHVVPDDKLGVHTRWAMPTYQ